MDFAKKPLDSIQMVMDEMVRGMDVLRNFASPTRQSERFSLTGATEETIALLRDRFSVKRVGLKLETAADAIVYGSSQELKQVLMNLLINAQEAVSREAGRRGTVSVRILPEAPTDANTGSFALLEVEDDGGGIPHELAGTLFDKFTTSKPSGSGLGLYLSRMIVERHYGGSISARNEGRGAVFTVRLPAAGQASGSIVTTVNASIPASFGGA
jgi:C4-dicarboxylate-specific signal transduction histidine kinase